MAELQDEKVSTVWTWAYSHAPAPLPVPREVLSARVRAIQAKLRAEGRHVGRPSRYAPKTQATMVEAYCTGVPTEQIMQHYAISRARLYALLQHAGVTGQRAVQPVMTCDHRARPRDSHGRFAPMPVPQLTLFATKD